VNVDVYADTLSNASGTYTPATSLVGYTGTGATSYTSVTYSNSTGITGQQITFSGQPAVSVALDSSNPAAGNIAQNTTGNTLAVYRFTETSNVESVKVTQFNVLDTVSSGTLSNFSNLQLWANGQLLGTAAGTSQTSSPFTFSFTGLSNFVIPQGGSLSVTLKGNAGSYTGGSITDGSNSTFAVSTTSVVAYGNTSNKTAAVSGSATGTAQTVLRSIETVTGTPVTTTPPASFQPIGSITVTSNAAGDTLPAGLTLTFNSTATSSFLNSVILKDMGGNLVATSSVSTTAYTVSWNASSFSKYVVTAGQSYTFTVWGDLSTIPSQTNAAQSLTAQIKGTGDYTYYDGPSSSYTTVSLPTIAVPITVVSLTSPVGGLF